MGACIHNIQFALFYVCEQEIELDYKGLTPAGCAALGAALRSNRSLKRLVLSRNPGIGDAGWDVAA